MRCHAISRSWSHHLVTLTSTSRHLPAVYEHPGRGHRGLLRCACVHVARGPAVTTRTSSPSPAVKVLLPTTKPYGRIEAARKPLVTTAASVFQEGTDTCAAPAPSTTAITLAPAMPATTLAVNVASWSTSRQHQLCLARMVPVATVPIASVSLATAVVPMPPADHCRENSRTCGISWFLSSRFGCSSHVKFYQSWRM